MEAIAKGYVIGGLIVSPLTTWYYVHLMRKFKDVSVGEVILAFFAACLPSLNIVMCFILGGFNFSWLSKTVFKKVSEQ